MKIGEIDLNLKLETKERELIKQLGRYPEVVISAGATIQSSTYCKLSFMIW